MKDTRLPVNENNSLILLRCWLDRSLDPSHPRYQDELRFTSQCCQPECQTVGMLVGIVSPMFNANNRPRESDPKKKLLSLQSGDFKKIVSILKLY